MRREQGGPRWWAPVAAAALLAAGLAWMLVPNLIRDAYDGRSAGAINALITGQSRFTADQYVAMFKRTLAGMVGAGAIVTVLVALACRTRERAGSDVGRRAAAGVLLTFLALIIFTRAFYYHEAFERDLMVYTTVAEGMLDGRPLYAAMWDHKPPAIHFTYAAAVALFGPTPLALWVLGVGAACATLWLCYEAGRLVMGRRGGLAAAALWLIAGGDLLLQANQPNVEVFMNVCLAAAFVLMLIVARRRVTLWTYVGAGGLFFLATLYKPVVAVTAVAVVGGGALAAALRAGDDVEPAGLATWRAVRGTCAAGLTAGVGWTLVLLYFWLTQRLDAFVEAVIEYNRDYAGDISGNLLRGLVPSLDVLLPLLPYVPLVIAVGVVGLSWNRDQQRGPWLLLLAYLASTWLAATMPGRPYPHYFQLMLPPVAIGGGWLIALALKRASVSAIAACGLLVFAPLAARAYQSFVPLAEVPVLKYGRYGRDLLQTQQMAGWINQTVDGSGVVYHWGPDPGVYFYAGRRSPVDFVFNLPLLDGTARAARYSQRVLGELQRREPDLIVARRLDMRTIDNPVETWIEDRYRQVPGPDGSSSFLFYVRRNHGGQGGDGTNDRAWH